MAVYSCIDQAVAFFTKMCSSLVANPNLTSVNVYEVWLLVHRVLQTSEVEFIANVDCKLLFSRLVQYVGSTEELLSKQLVCESFPFVIYLFGFFYKDMTAMESTQKILYFSDHINSKESYLK